jgi:hypothetical protein
VGSQGGNRPVNGLGPNWFSGPVFNGLSMDGLKTGLESKWVGLVWERRKTVWIWVQII